MLEIAQIISQLTPIFGTLLLAVLFYNLLKCIVRTRKLPPGPYAPGLTLQSGADKDPSLLKAWHERWGEVASFRVAHILCIVANTNSAISQMLVKNGDSSSGRFQSSFIHHFFNFSEGVIGAYGEEWRQRRSFILGIFRQFGFSKYEVPIEHECQYMIDQFKQFDGKVFNPLMPINSAVSNVIYQLLFGERMDRDEMKRFEKIITRVNDFITDQNFNNNFLIEVLGRAAFLIPGDPFHVKRQYDNMTELGEYFNEQKVRKLAEPTTGEPSCLLDAMLRSGKFTDGQIRSLMFDLLIAGMETTTTTLRWSLILMAKYPDVQRKVRDEIRERLEGKTPTYNDRSALVYTEAVIHEVERFVTIVPLSIPHMATADFMLNGYLIPKGSLLIPNLYAAHHDEKVWPYADTFNPANFYDESTKSLKNLENLVPFSVGRRSCLGETLAKQELFIFFAGLLQNFEISEAESQPLPDLKESYLTVVRGPKPFSIIARKLN